MAGLSLVSPGIKVKEVDLTRGGITGVSDQTGAIAGPFCKGPINEPTLVENEKDLVDTFGESKDGNYEYWMSASSYLSYGGALRVVRSDSRPSIMLTLLLRRVQDLLFHSKSKIPKIIIMPMIVQLNGTESAKNPGTWGNGLKVCVIDARLTKL